MRRVFRGDISAPALLEEKGAIEHRKAVAYFEKFLAGSPLGKDDKAPSFSAYKDKTLSLVLNNLFFGKCAYCESRYAGIHPVDIEHWRPKGDVFDDTGKSREFGYYWLAASWENLLPSCIDCNRIRTHRDYITKQEISLGKGNWFPLTDEGKRARVPDGESDEDPLLLNPCIDDPVEYLVFDDQGLVLPRKDLDEVGHKRATASIRFYALNRSELVQDRHARQLLIKQKMHTIMRLVILREEKLGIEGIDDVVEDVLAHELEALYEFQKPYQPFSQMAVQMIDEFMEGFRPSTQG